MKNSYMEVFAFFVLEDLRVLICFTVFASP
jgi:hypothetical protein